MITFAQLRADAKKETGHDMTLNEWKLVHQINQTFLSEQGRYMDAGESMTLVRSLTQFTNAVYMVKINADLKFSQVLPLLPSGIAPSVRKIGWTTLEDIGSLDFLANGAGDLKTLSMNRDEKTIDIKIAGGRIAWSWQDIEAAIFQEIALPTESGMMARRLTDLFHDRVTAKGDTTFKVEGLLTSQADMTDIGSIAWSGLADINAKVEKLQQIYRAVSDATGYTFTGGIEILPPKYYREIEDSPYGDNKDKTALDYLEQVYHRRGLQIIEWQQFANVTVENYTNKDVVMAFPFTPEAGENMIVDPFFMKPPKEDENYNVSAGVFTKTAGVAKRQPKSFVHGRLN